MAVKRPRSRIIRIVLDDEVSERRQVLRIPALGVRRVIDVAGPLTGAGGEDVHVVAVQVHGVRGGVVVPDVDADAGVGLEVDDIPFGVVGVRVVLLLGEEEDGIVVVALEGVAVHVEELLAGGVDELVDGHVVCYAWFGQLDRVERDGFAEGVVGALAVVEGCGIGGCGWDCGVGSVVDEDDGLSFGVGGSSSSAVFSGCLSSHPDACEVGFGGEENV